MLIVHHNLIFACEDCINTNREVSCTHYHNISQNDVYAISHSLPNPETRLKLITATLDLEMNPICPNSEIFCFDCPHNCCSNDVLNNVVFLSSESVVTEIQGRTQLPLISSDSWTHRLFNFINKRKKENDYKDEPTSAISLIDSLFDETEQISTSLTIPPDNVSRVEYIWNDTRNMFISADGLLPW